MKNANEILNFCTKIVLIVIFIIIGIIIPRYFMPESKVVEYRIRSLDGSFVIDGVVEDGGDYVIALPQSNIEEALDVLERLNKSIK